MAILASQQVIDGIVDRLVAAATSSGVRVYSDRFHPVSAFPSIRVKHVDEDLQAGDDDVTWPAMRLHRLQVDVDVLVQAAAGLDAALAAAALEVLQALEGMQSPLAPLNVALAATGIRYQATSDGQASHGVATVRLAAEYHTATNTPHTIA